MASVEISDALAMSSQIFEVPEGVAPALWDMLVSIKKDVSDMRDSHGSVETRVALMEEQHGLMGDDLTSLNSKVADVLESKVNAWSSHQGGK